MGKSVEKLSIPVMIFCIIGVVLLVLGFLLVKNNNFRLQVISAEGVVTGVQTSNDSDGKIINKVLTLAYAANRSSYTATISDVNSDLKIGDKKILYYDILEPSSVSDRRNGYQGYIALIFGAILVLKTGPRFYRIIKENFLWANLALL